MAPQVQSWTSQFPVSPNHSSQSSKTPSFSDSISGESDDTIQTGNPLFSALCMFDFTSSEVGMLSFSQNEILDIVKRENEGWWAAMRKGGSTLGWIPAAFVSPLSQEMTERLRDIREELRVAEFKRAKELNHSAQDSASFLIFGDGSVPPSPKSKDLANLPSSKWSAQLYHDHSGELLDIRKGQTLVDLPRFMSRSRLPQTTSTHHRPLARSTSAQINPLSPHPKTVDDSRIRGGSLSIRGSQRHPAIVDHDVSLSPMSVGSANPKQIDNLTASRREMPTSFRAISNVIHKQAQEDKVQRKFTEAGGTSFRALSNVVYKQLQVSKVGSGLIEAGGPVINIGHPEPDDTPWYLRSQYTGQLDTDSKGNVRTGTLLSLFEMLTIDPGTSDNTKLAQLKTFTNVFLMTFRTFTTADRLFDMLVERFHLKPEKVLTEYEYVDWKENLRNPVQRLVLEVFSIWLEKYRLLEEEPHIAQRLKEFLALIVFPPHNVTATIIIQAIDRLTSANSVPMDPSLILKQARKVKTNKYEVFKHDSKAIAEQLTVYEFGLYVKITPQQCLTYAKSHTGDGVAKLRDFCSTHDSLGAWVKMSILDGGATGRRATIVDYWIKVAERCRVLNNISSMSAIITALSSTVITALQLTWALTSRRQALEGLLRYSKPTGGFAGYRSLLQKAEGSCVPFITMFLTEMAHVQEQFSESEERIWFYQRARWYEIITAMLKYQSRPYNIAADKSTINYIESHLREGGCRDPGWFWKRSQEVQRDEETHADIRKGLEAAGF